MKYYVLEIATGDDKIKGASVGTHEDENEKVAENKAIASFRKKLGTAMSSELYTSDLLVVVREDGFIEKVEKYVAEVTE